MSYCYIILVMADDVPFNPDVSDPTFEHVLEQSHKHASEVPNNPKENKKLASEQKELAALDAAWKKGELSYHEYMTKKYELQKSNRGWR